MSDAAPDSIIGGEVPRPSRRGILMTTALSVTLHLLLIGWLLLPPRTAEPAEPPAISVELVPPEMLSSEASSSVAPSSEPPPSSEEASSEAPSSEAPASEAASSVEPASSAEPPSAEPTSSEAAASAEPASSAPPPASEAASSVEAPVPQARPIVLPVGPSEEASGEASSAEPGTEQPSALTAEDGTAGIADGAVAGDASSAEPPPITGALHAAKRFYLDAILNSAQMAKAREAIKKLPPEKRLAQTCNIEAVGQLGSAGRGYEPDAIIADAFARPAIAGATFTVSAGAFRSKGKWTAIAYTCTLSKDMEAVRSFTYRTGGDVTALLKSRLSG